MAKLTQKIAYIGFGDILGKGFSFLATVYLARTLGTEGFGIISIAIAYLGYFVFFADFGLHNIGSREVAKNPAKRVFTPAELYISRILMALTIFVLGWFLLPYIIKNPKQLEVTKLFLLPLIPHAFLLEWYFNGGQRFFTSASSKAIQNGVYALLVIIFVDGMLDLTFVPLFYTSGLILAAFFLIVVVSKDSEFKGKIRPKIFPQILKSAGSVGSGLFFGQLVLLLPPITIGYFISTSDAGLYGAAYRLIVIGLIVDRLFVPLLLPNLSKQWSENKERASIHMNHTSRIILTVGSVLTLFIAVGAEDFTVWVFGNKYVDSVPLVVVLSLFLFFTFQNSMFSHGLVAMGKDQDFFKASAIGGILVLIMLVGASAFYNTETVAVAVIVGEFLKTGVAYYWFNKQLSFNYLVPFLFSLILGALVFLVFGFIDFVPWINACFSAFILLISLRLVNVLRKEDIQWLKSKLMA